MKIFTEFVFLCYLFFFVSVPLYWALVGLECFVLSSWRKGLSQTGTFATLVSAQFLSPFSYFLFLSIVPGSEDTHAPGRMFYISDREVNAATATVALCIFLLISSVFILRLRGRQIWEPPRRDFDE